MDRAARSTSRISFLLTESIWKSGSSSLTQVERLPSAPSTWGAATLSRGAGGRSGGRRGVMMEVWGDDGGDDGGVGP